MISLVMLMATACLTLICFEVIISNVICFLIWPQVWSVNQNKLSLTWERQLAFFDLELSLLIWGLIGIYLMLRYHPSYASVLTLYSIFVGMLLYSLSNLRSQKTLLGSLIKDKSIILSPNKLWGSGQVAPCKKESSFSRYSFPSKG